MVEIWTAYGLSDLGHHDLLDLAAILFGYAEAAKREDPTNSLSDLSGCRNIAFPDQSGDRNGVRGTGHDFDLVPVQPFRFRWLACTR